MNSVVSSVVEKGLKPVEAPEVSEEMGCWLSELDFMGTDPSHEDLQELMARCPDPGHPEAVKVSGILAPDTFSSF